jgi:hypothetical protein
MRGSKFFTATTALLLAMSTGSFAADDVPKAREFARYEPMMNRSPFAVATAVAAPVVAPNFAKDLYIANAARSPDGDLVTIASSTDKNFKKYLTTTEPAEGFSISNIEWSDKVGATKVTISKDGQFATLTFNQALLSQPLASAQPQPVLQPQNAMQPQPGQAVPALGMTPTAGFGQPLTNQPIKPAPIPTLPTPPARTRNVIQRNPSAPPPPAPTPAGDADS